MTGTWEVEHAAVDYDGAVALDAVDLSVAAGEVVSVLGPSGSGKTTLLRAIAGLEPLRDGAVLRDGADLAGVPPHRRDVGLMFQDHALFPHRDVLGNVLFGLRMHGVGRDEADRRAREALALVGLAGFERRGVRDLSGGEQQRVALARALAPEPRLLMLDEPLGSLDRELRERLAEDLRVLFTRLAAPDRGDAQLAALFVTHDQDEAFAVGDRVAVMVAGRIEQVGAAAEVWARPRTATVARFLGWDVRTWVPGAGLGAVRPEHVRIGPASAAAVTGTVLRSTFHRGRHRVRVSPLGPAETELEAIADAAPDPGTVVGLAVDPAAVVPVEG